MLNMSLKDCMCFAEGVWLGEGYGLYACALFWEEDIGREIACASGPEQREQWR